MSSAQRCTAASLQQCRAVFAGRQSETDCCTAVAIEPDCEGTRPVQAGIERWLQLQSSPKSPQALRSPKPHTDLQRVQLQVVGLREDGRRPAAHRGVHVQQPATAAGVQAAAATQAAAQPRRRRPVVRVHLRRLGQHVARVAGVAAGRQRAKVTQNGRSARGTGICAWTCSRQRHVHVAFASDGTQCTQDHSVSADFGGPKQIPPITVDCNHLP